MNNRLKWIVVALVLAVQGAWADAETSYPPELKPEPYEAQAAHLAAELLSRYHYKKVPIDDALSGKIPEAGEIRSRTNLVGRLDHHKT